AASREVLFGARANGGELFSVRRRDARNLQPVHLALTGAARAAAALRIARSVDGHTVDLHVQLRLDRAQICRCLLGEHLAYGSVERACVALSRWRYRVGFPQWQRL